MIVFEVRSDGTVISTPSFVAQGISLSDLVVLADADYSLVTMHFTPPSGIYIPDVVFTPTLTQGRNLWQAVMPPEISRISGAVTYQIFLTSADGKTLPTPTGRITVQEGVISNMPETAEELGQYSISALYQLMANFYASLEGYRQTLDGLTVKTYKWTILASDWTDSTPYQATILFPHGNYAKPGTLILVAPADNRSREQIEKGELTVTVHDNGVIGDVPLVDTAVIVRGGKAPTEDINLVLFFIDTQGKDEPMTQWIGVDMGTGLPEVTPEDDGKVLGVSGGVWRKVKGSTFYTVIIPAADSENKHGWQQVRGIYELFISAEWMTSDLIIELQSESAEIFTDCDLVLHQDDGIVDLSMQSLPAKQTILYIFIPAVHDGGTLNGGAV